jgi:hypothetical protein
VPGWSQPVRLPPPAERNENGWLLDPEMMALFQDVLRALEPFPEARRAVAEAMDQHGMKTPRPRKRKPEGAEPPPAGEALPGPGAFQGPGPDVEVWVSPDQLPKGDGPASGVTPPAPSQPADPGGGGSTEETPPSPGEHRPGEVP